jgi:hypothetical protein
MQNGCGGISLSYLPLEMLTCALCTYEYCLCRVHNNATKQAAILLKFLTHIQEALGLNLCLAISFPNWGFSWSLQAHSLTVPPLRYYWSLPSSFSFIVHKSSYHSTWYTVFQILTSSQNKQKTTHNRIVKTYSEDSDSRLRIFSSPRHPDRLWGLTKLLSNGYRGLFLLV